MGRKQRHKKLLKLKQKSSAALNHSRPRFSAVNISFWGKVLLWLSIPFFLLTLTPLLHDGIFSGHDILIHLGYLQKFQETLRQGQFPVRVTDWITPGLNQPVFNFYQPGFFYLVQLPKLAGLSDITAIKILISFLWLLSGLFMYLFVNRHYGKHAGVVAAVFYLYAPYHIADLFVRAALPEFSALAFVPGTFWAITAYAKTQKESYLTLVSFFIALVAVCHPPTLIMFAWVICLYTLILFWLNKSFVSLVYLTLSYIVGIGIAAFFLMPAFFEQQYIQSSFLHTGNYNYQLHFVCLPQLFSLNWNYGISVNGCDDTMSFQLGIVHWLVAAAIAYYFLQRLTKFILPKKKPTYAQLADLSPQKPADPFLLFFFLSLIVSLGMTTSFFGPAWDTLPLLNLFQYPWRWLAVSIFAASFLAGSALNLVKNELLKYLMYVLLLGMLFVSSKDYFQPAQYINEEEVWAIIHGQKTFNGINPPKPELGYYPKWAFLLPEGEDVPRNEVKDLSNAANIEVKKSTPTAKIYLVSSEKQSQLLLYTHYFPGWKIMLQSASANKDAEYTSLPFTYSNEYGYIQTSIPPGKHTLFLEFTDTPIRKIANIISIASLILALCFLILRKTKPTVIRVEDGREHEKTIGGAVPETLGRNA